MTSRPTAPDEMPRIAVPADIDTPDRIAWGLSFRQLAILSGPAGALWLAYSRFTALLPPAVWVGTGILVLGVAVVVALGRRDGLPLEAWLRHAVTLRMTPPISTPGASPAGRPLVVTVDKPLIPAPLRSDLTQITPDGTVSTENVSRAVIACGTTSVTLRTGTEQLALLEGFGRWLNSLTGPAQILVQAARHDLTPSANSVLDAAPRLPHSALREAAADYAAFLLELDETREPLRRQVLAVVTGAHARESSVRALTSLGITAQPLDGYALCAALAAAADPFDPPVPGPRAIPGHPVSARRTPS